MTFGRGWVKPSGTPAYTPDAVGTDEIRQFAAGVLQRLPLPSDLEQLAIRILRHV